MMIGAGQDELELHKQCFVFYDFLKRKHGLNTHKSVHFWYIVEYFFGSTAPKPFHRNPWAEKMIWEYCDNKILSFSGCASSGKTTVAALWCLINWAVDPHNTKVIVTSTSIKGARNRIWGQIREFHAGAGYVDKKGVPRRLSMPGVIVDSVGIIRLDQKKDGATASQMSTIELVAAEQSQEKEAVDKFIGLKNENVICILDEAPDISPALLSAAFGNLNANKNFQLVALGNFKSISDTFGQISTPVKGWSSVNVETQEWETVYSGQRGKCVRFDGTKSPNVEAGKNVYPGLYSVEKFEKDLGMGENTVEYWRFCRSFLVPANVSDRVYSEADFINGGCFDGVKWKRDPIKISMLDPAFTSGGDNAIAIIAEFGESMDGKYIMAPLLVEQLKEDVTVKDMPFDFQIAHQWVNLSKSHGVSPFNAVFDRTGAGISFGSLIHQIWSPQVLGVGFGDAASDRPVSEADPTTCRERYANRVSELWFQGKEFVRAGQIKRLPISVSEELVARKRKDPEKNVSGKAAVEPKALMKARIGKSPDRADTFLMGVELLRERHGWTAGRFGKGLQLSQREEQDSARQFDEIYDESALLHEAA